MGSEKMGKETAKSTPSQQMEDVGQLQAMSPPVFQLQTAPIQREGDPVGPGHYAASQNTRTIGFALRHPWAAMAIGSVSSGSTNISTNAVRFSTNDLGLSENASHEGSQVNAFRHTLWQAEITNQYGADIAHEVGNAHETNPFAISGANASKREFDTLSQADEACDLRNNIIGRSLGNHDSPAAMNVAALAVLDYFHTTGLWVAQRNDAGKFVISQQLIPEDQYQEARRRLLALNANGFDAAQQGARDEAARRELERQVQRDMRGPKF